MASMCKFEMRANLIWPSGYSEPLTLPGNPGSNFILVTEFEIQFVFPDESRKLPRIITAAREHLPSAAQRGVFRHSPPIPGSKLLLSMCPHPDISEYYTVRHNAAGKELTKGIRGVGRWLTITNFGMKIDGLGDPETIPPWMLSA